MRCLPRLDGYYITCSTLRKTVVNTRLRSEQNTRLNLVYLSAVKIKGLLIASLLRFMRYKISEGETLPLGTSHPVILRQVHSLFQSEFSSFGSHYTLRSRSSSGCLRLLPRVSVSYTLSFIFPTVTFLYRQFLRKV
jgi:hypothetical protein